MLKILTPLLLATFALGGCVAYEPAPPPHHYGYRDGPPPPRYDGDRDRDRDGVPNRYDRAPNNPNYR
nr:hypothetical protein [Variovorax sp. OV329]